MKPGWKWLLLLATVTSALVGCTASHPRHSRPDLSKLADELRALKDRFAADSHMSVYTVGIEPRRGEMVLTGDVDRVEARIETLRAAERWGIKVADRIRVLPDAGLGETNWGITALSVANGREGTAHMAELGTQTLMGEVVRVLQRQGRWFRVQSADQYLSWMESGSLKLCTRAEADAWEKSPLLIVTEFDGLIREAPGPDAPPVSDIVIGCRVKKTGDAGAWFKVELPDGRSGYLAKHSAQDYLAWKNARHATPDTIERTARQFLGRPYLWGANTPRGLDCSGFTKLVFFLNGIELRRNASQQAQQGNEVPLSRDLDKLKKGDLLFFGFEGRGERRGRVSHTGIYLGDKLFIQSSQRVRVSSLDPESPLADPARIRGLLKARRVLPED